MLRFDAKRNGASKSVSHNFSSPYFDASMISYTLALMFTFAMTNIFKAAQPALLYLVPALLLTNIGLAYKRNEINLLVGYTEEDEEKVTDKSEQPDKVDEPSKTTAPKAEEPAGSAGAVEDERSPSPATRRRMKIK